MSHTSPPRNELPRVGEVWWRKRASSSKKRLYLVLGPAFEQRIFQGSGEDRTLYYSYEQVPLLDLETGKTTAANTKTMGNGDHWGRFKA